MNTSAVIARRALPPHDVPADPTSIAETRTESILFPARFAMSTTTGRGTHPSLHRFIAITTGG